MTGDIATMGAMIGAANGVLSASFDLILVDNPA